jgi:hypothetical protein
MIAALGLDEKLTRPVGLWAGDTDRPALGDPRFRVRDGDHMAYSGLKRYKFDSMESE